MPTLPVRPDLDQLRRQAKELVRAARSGDVEALARIDPWLRTHWRLGAKVVAMAPASQTMTAAVAQWERWAGLLFPDSGDYIIPDGLSTLRVDKGRNQGTYIEPNVWMQHR